MSDLTSMVSTSSLVLVSVFLIYTNMECNQLVLTKCKKSPYYSTLHCNYPMQPWRQYHGLSENEAYKMSIKELLTNRSTSMSQSLQQQPLMGNVKLSDLTQGSVNGMSTSA
ncbi:unnamed protein product [Heterobilharzia americana]|nr:unnamed protein product [Heterobilharzia americana]